MPLCPIHQLELVEGEPYRQRKKFVCPKGGCDVALWHGSTSTPADQRTRTLRNRCHAAFDPLWKNGQFKRREQAYRYLGNRMGLTREQCHFGMFTAEQCEEALRIIDRLKLKIAQES